MKVFESRYLLVQDHINLRRKAKSLKDLTRSEPKLKIIEEGKGSTLVFLVRNWKNAKFMKKMGASEHFSLA